MANENNSIVDTLNNPGRRSVLKVAAWSVPAVTVASAAPAFAATPGEPGPLPTGLAHNWTANLSVGTAGTTRWVNRYHDQTVAYNLFDDNEDLIPAGTYYTDVFFTFSWNVNASLTPQLLDDHGWIISSGGLTPGESGSVTFIRNPRLLNGNAYAVTLPRIRIDPSAGATGPFSGIVNTGLDGTNLGAIGGSAAY